MNKNKGNTLIVLLVILVLVLLASLWVKKTGYKFPNQTAQEPGIQNTSDLDAASKLLDENDPSQMDKGINQITSDSSSF